MSIYGNNDYANYASYRNPQQQPTENSALDDKLNELGPLIGDLISSESNGQEMPFYNERAGKMYSSINEIMQFVHNKEDIKK
jgi:hypothetical protein